MDYCAQVLPCRHTARSVTNNAAEAERGAWRDEDWNSFVFFSDPDGNGWTVQERPAGD